MGFLTEFITDEVACKTHHHQAKWFEHPCITPVKIVCLELGTRQLSVQCDRE